MRLQAYKAVIKEAKAMGAAKERKRAASAIAVSDDDEEGFDWRPTQQRQRSTSICEGCTPKQKQGIQC